MMMMYSLDQEEGGDCSLIRQFLLIDSDTEDRDLEAETGTDSGNASDSGNVSETGSRTSPAPGESRDQSYLSVSTSEKSVTFEKHWKP